MNSLDKQYLIIQFQNKILKLFSTEFQSFFENIFEKKFSDFQKIRPFGKMGDGGNDGYFKNSGSYYQVYSPLDPKLKESNAASKLREDFNRIKEEWNDISEIKEYHFVFNDKYNGSIQLLEKEITILNKENPNIIFDLLLSKELENIFFQLEESDILSLGFDINRRVAIENASSYLEIVKIEIDKEFLISSKHLLNMNEKIIFDLNDETLLLEYDLLNYKCLKLSEDISSAISLIESISLRYPDDIRPILYLAGTHYSIKNYDKFCSLLNFAANIDKNNDLLKYYRLLEKIHLNQSIDLSNIKEDFYLDDAYKKSILYSLYALLFTRFADYKSAISFIEKAIRLNPDKFDFYIKKFTILEAMFYDPVYNDQKLQLITKMSDVIILLNNKFLNIGIINTRAKLDFLNKKFSLLIFNEKFNEIEIIINEISNLILKCYFDSHIDNIIIKLLTFSTPSLNDLITLLSYLEKTSIEISNSIIERLIHIFNLSDVLFTKGKDFLTKINNHKYLNFIKNIEINKHNEVLKFLKNNTTLAHSIIISLPNNFDLKHKIIGILPDASNKQLLLLNIYLTEKDNDNAYNLIKKIDLSNLHYSSYPTFLPVLHAKKDWAMTITVLKKILENNNLYDNILNFEIQLFNAYLYLNKYLELINHGILLLENYFDSKEIHIEQKENLLTLTIQACFERGKIDNEYFLKSRNLLEKYVLPKLSFEFIINIQTRVYLHCNEITMAWNSIVSGVRSKKILSDEDYAHIRNLLIFDFSNKLDISQTPLDFVIDDTFVKLEENDDWYYIGNDNELDAIKTSDNKYKLLIGKSIGNEIDFSTKYRSSTKKFVIENILSLDNYIIYRSSKSFKNLTENDNLSWAQLIDIPKVNGSSDFSNLFSILNDINSNNDNIFKSYCNNIIPLSVLAVSEGSLTKAIGRIQQDNDGFVNFSLGSVEEFEKQKEIVKRILNNNESLLIDGTSALLLTEINYIDKIISYFPNFKVPQSVVNFLINATDNFHYSENQVGHISVVDSKISFSSLNNNYRDNIKDNFVKAVKTLESNPTSVISVSPSSKSSCFAEQDIHAELCDACISAQIEDIPILTEDFRYLEMNELQTDKKSPQYFSSFALVRVLYDENKISIEEYLNFFYYLSVSRYKFLFVNPNDIFISVFGNKEAKSFIPENIKKFNLSFILSEEYDVDLNSSFNVFCSFILKCVIDNSITLEYFKVILIEIMNSFPVSWHKQTVAFSILKACEDTIKVVDSNFDLPEIKIKNSYIVVDDYK